jgi:hypothetical protein
MTGIKKYVIKKLADFQRLKLMQLFSVFYDAKSFNSFIIKEINLHGTVLLAPRPKLGGVTFGQFIFADTWYTDYQISENINDLHRFVASLYLPKGQPFSEEIVEKSIKTISHESQAKLEAISLNYMFVREWLSDVYPLIFIKSDNDEIGKKLKKRQPVNSWIKIFENLVGDDIVNHDNYANMPIHNIFRFMTAKIKENMKRKR